MQLADYEWEVIPRGEIIGGSDIAAILGLSKWTTPQQLLQRKALEESIKVNEPMFWGTRLESAIADVYEERYCDKEHSLFDPVKDWDRGHQVRHPDHPWLAASPDRLLIKGDFGEIVGGLEIKNIGTFSKKSWKESVPVYYQTQAQTYMMVFGLPSWEFYVLCGGNDPFHVELEENPFMQEKILREGKNFYTALQLCNLMTVEEALKNYETILTEGEEDDQNRIDVIPMGKV